MDFAYCRDTSGWWETRFGGANKRNDSLNITSLDSHILTSQRASSRARQQHLLKMLFPVYLVLLLPLALARAVNSQAGAFDVLRRGFDKYHLPQYWKRQFHAQSMLITNVYTLSFNVTAGLRNRGITCKSRSFQIDLVSWSMGISADWWFALAVDWIDPMSNTSTHCTATWLEHPDGSGYPVKFIGCEMTGFEEVFTWKFSYYGHYRNRSHSFVLDLVHIYKDPV